MTALRVAGLASLLLLIVVWAGYPLVVHLIARAKGPRAAQPLAEWPTATAVIATREAPDAIAARVANLRDTTYDPDRLEIVVAVDHAAAGLAGELAPGTGMKVVVGDAPGGKAAALNAGVRAATGDILIFSDTYQRFERDTIVELVSAFSDARVGAASGSLHLAPGGSGLLRRYWSMERRLRRDEARLHSVIGVTGAVYAMRRAAWRPLPDGLILDDLFGPMRLVLAGHRIDFVETAKATDHRITTADQEYRRKVRTLAGNLQLCAWLPGVLSPVANPVWIQFLLHKLARLLTPYWLLLIGIWVVAEIVHAMPGRALGALAAAGAVLALWIWRGRGGAARRLRSLVLWAATLQAAVIRGTWLGARGQWNVWQR